MQKRRRNILEPPALFVFLSFLFGLSNFIDTFLRLLFSYMLPIPYPLRVDLKPLFFILQAICLALFLYHIKSHDKSLAINNFWNLFKLQISILVTVIFLSLIYEFINPGRYGVAIYYTDTLWLLSYILGPSVTCFWFSSKLLKESRYRTFAVVFFLIGLAFASKIISETYFWPQTFFNFSLPPQVDIGNRLLTTTLILLALFYTRVLLSIRRSTKKSLISLLRNAQLYVVVLALITPFFLNNYKEGLLNLISRAIVYWGLGYTGQSWYFTSLYLAALVIYLSLIIDLNRVLDNSVASSLILLGVVSFPWNGIMVFDFGYSSIPGNMLSISALIVGYLLRKRNHKEPVRTRNNLKM